MMTRILICDDSIDYSKKLLPQSHIVRPHKSFIVNLDYIRSCENSAVCMRDGARISVPKDFKTVKKMAGTDIRE